MLDSDLINDIEKPNYDNADTISIDTDTQTVIQCFINNSPQPSSSSSEGTIIADSIKNNEFETENCKYLDPIRTQAIKKLLTEPIKENNQFVRDVSINRSFKVEKSKANDLDFITDKHKRVDFLIFLANI